MSDKDWFLGAYDDYVAGEPEGTELEKSRDAVAHAYADAVDNGDIQRWSDDLVAEGRALFDRVVKPERDRRKGGIRSAMDRILDALSGDTILGADDPILDLAYPLGDGRDKTLRYWTQDDWQAATTARYRNAATVTEAAAKFDDGSREIVNHMRSRKARATGDMFIERSANAA